MTWDVKPPQPDPTAAARAVKAPAIIMIVTASLGLVGAILSFFMNAMALEAMREMHEQQNQKMPEIFEVIYGPLGSVIAVGTAILCAVALPAGIRMLSLRSWGLAVAGSICSILTAFSCSCCGLGAVAGVWALVVLSRPEVKSAFR